MDRAETPSAERGGAGGNGNQADMPGVSRCCAQSAFQHGPQQARNGALAQFLEGQHRLRQFLPVRPDGDNRHQNRAVHRKQRRCLGLRPKGPGAQPPYSARAGTAELGILAPAAHALHRCQESRQITPGQREAFQEAEQQPRVPAPVTGSEVVRGGRVEVVNAGPAGVVSHVGHLGRLAAAPKTGTGKSMSPAWGTDARRARLLALYVERPAIWKAPRGEACYPGKAGSTGPFSWSSQPLPTRWNTPARDCP